MGEFKIGDKVEFYKMNDEQCSYEKYLGKVGEIKKFGLFGSREYACVELENGIEFNPYLKNIRPIKNIIKKTDLQNGDIVTYRNGDKRIVDERNATLVYLEDFTNKALSLSSFDEDLLDKDTNEESQWDIVKVYRPSTEETFRTERTEKVKEMTLKEVCKELGYEVKIVKEEN